MRVAVVGCGRMGLKRARALPADALVAAADVHLERARALAETSGRCTAAVRWGDVVARDDVDAVVVATTHDALAAVALGAVRAGKHVLIEKPAARTREELRPVAEAARARGVTVAVGFNHRFHPALRKAHALLAEGAIGAPLYVRARYGHGGRPGYEREWRADPAVSGGGELIDQGAHLVDLALWFLGPLALRSAHLPTVFWEAPVEDNAFLHLEGGGRTAWLHASWTEWKNLFSFELFGREGVLTAEGLGGSYGPERLTLARLRREMGPPDLQCWPFPDEDVSWADEWRAFTDAVGGKPTDGAGLDDALAVLEVVGAAYARGGGTGPGADRP